MLTSDPFVLNNISKSFGAVHALRNVTMSVRSNEVIGLIGENGAGKSTLLKILAGIHRPDDGEILVGGQKRVFGSPTAAAAAGIAVVHQEQSLILNLSVAENILMSMRSNGSARGSGVVRLGVYNWREINRIAAQVLARIGCDIDPRTRIDALSFADRQMVEIAKAIQVSAQPGTQPIIVLDEPTSVLEDQDVRKLEAEVKQLKQIGSVIFVSHRLDEVMRFSDRIYVLRGGEVVGERPTNEVNEDDLFRLMTGRTSHAPGVRPAPADPVSAVGGDQDSVLDVSGLTKKGKFADIDFRIGRGEICAFVGTNNSGREDVCRAVFGADDFDSGSIRYMGRPLGKPVIRSGIRKGIAYLPSERRAEGMVAGLTVAENLSLTHPGASRAGPFIHEGRRRDVAKAWIKRLNIRPPHPEADIASLSGGNQQKVVVAKWLEDPNLKLLILDHPTRGIDPGAREDVSREVREACANGACVLLIADTLEEALAIATTIHVMRDGRITGTYDLRVEAPPSHAELLSKMI